jgi:hypothetical protein
VKKPKKYVIDRNKLPETECRVKDCHHDKAPPTKEKPYRRYCRLHEDRVAGIFKTKEERIAERLMEG